MAELLLEPTPGSVPCEHLVQVYNDRFELAEAVATYFASGFAAGEPAIAVATAAHWPAIAERLASKGWDAEMLAERGKLTVADAETTLESISEDGIPSRRRFNELIGALVDDAAADSPTRRVRVFGEMVDLLCRRGDQASADALEAMWNRLGARQNFTLLCGYKVEIFDRGSQVTLLPQIYRSHSHVLPRADAERLEAAIDTALREVLGDSDAAKLYAQVAKHLTDERIPLTERALMWASAHMPRAAERVFASVRASSVAATTA